MWRQKLFITPIERRVVIMGNLNYKVTNGGFSQWIDNGYFNPETRGVVFDAINFFNNPVTQKLKILVMKVESILEKDYEYVRGEYLPINRNSEYE